VPDLQQPRSKIPLTTPEAIQVGDIHTGQVWQELGGECVEHFSGKDFGGLRFDEQMEGVQCMKSQQECWVGGISVVDGCIGEGGLHPSHQLIRQVGPVPRGEVRLG
jgi:hypothetical protein